jgi:hypothetical protein
MRLKRALILCLFALAGLPLAGATIKPESVGLSEERLSRIHDTMQRHIDSHDISGAVTLVARKGQIAWFHWSSRFSERFKGLLAWMNWT